MSYQEILAQTDAQAVYERDKIRLALEETVRAWEALSGGWHRPGEVDRWLSEEMFPAINQARVALGRDPKPRTPR